MVSISVMNDLFPPFEDENLKAPQDVPLFPLSKVVLLPGEPLPLHIFEERYQMMAESAISSERLIAMAHLKPRIDKSEGGNPEIFDVCGLGRIVLDERLSDGKFNLILVGLKRIRIKRIVQLKPYKRAEVEILADRFSQTSGPLLSSLSAEITGLAQELLGLRKKFLEEVPGPIFDQFPSQNLPLGTLCDLLAAALSLPPLDKQMVMEEMDVIRRAEILRFALKFELGSLLNNSALSRPVLH